MIQGMSYQQLNWQMKERLTKRDQPSILYDASQSVFSGDGLISESVNEDELHAAWTKEEAAIATRPEGDQPATRLTGTEPDSLAPGMSSFRPFSLPPVLGAAIDYLDAEGSLLHEPKVIS